MLNPVFSIKHMRDLIPVFYPIAHQVSTVIFRQVIGLIECLQLSDILERKIRSGEDEINFLGWMSRAALQYIGVGGLGYSFDALDENAKNEYSDVIKLFR